LFYKALKHRIAFLIDGLDPFNCEVDKSNQGVALGKMLPLGCPFLETTANNKSQQVIPALLFLSLAVMRSGVRSLVAPPRKIRHLAKSIVPFFVTPHRLVAERLWNVTKEIKMLRRKPRGLQKRKTFKEVAEVLNNKGYSTSSDKPFTAMNVHKIIKRQG